MRLLLLGVVATLLVNEIAGVPAIAAPVKYGYATNDTTWWENAFFYQIYVRSFRDSDADGTGDLRGIHEQIGYLSDLGVDAIILSYVLDSNHLYFGIDTTNFFDVASIYGSIQDFEDLINAAHEKNIKVVLDLVAGHTSMSSEWFRQSKRRDEKYVDYYVWHKGVPNPGEGGPTLPPNNWQSVYGGSAWTWSDEREEYYFHQFSEYMPQLNLENPMVLEDLELAFTTWLELGVDGIKISAANFLAYDLALRDEPSFGNGELDHIHTRDLDRAYEIVGRWRKLVDSFDPNPTRIIMTEAFTTRSNIVRWYGTQDAPISHVPFNHAALSTRNAQDKIDAYEVQSLINMFLNEVPEWATSSLILGTHDINRVASRFSDQQINGFNTLVMTLPGAALTYYGEEIGMEDNFDIPFEQTQDPRACNAGPEDYLLYNRDVLRTPFQWDDSISAGFSSSIRTWVAVHQNFVTRNLYAQTNSSLTTYFKYFESLGHLRRHEIFQNGDFESHVIDNVFVYSRSVDRASGGYLVAINFNTYALTLDNEKVLPASTVNLIPLLRSSNFNQEQGPWLMQGFEAIVFEYNFENIIRPPSNDSHFVEIVLSKIIEDRSDGQLTKTRMFGFFNKTVETSPL